MNIDKVKINGLFIQYGSAAAEAMLDFPYHIFQLPDSIGVILYRIEYHCAIVIGDPICPSEEVERITRAFFHYCTESKLKIIFITVSEKFKNWALNHFCQISIEVCEEYVINPQIDIFSNSHRMRHRVNDAIKHGITFHEYIPFSADIEKSIKEVGQKWQKKIKGPHLYLGHLNFFESYEGRRWFYTQEDEKITSMAMLCGLDSRQGWLLKFLTTIPEASHFTSEFLMASVLDTLKKENCSFLSKGMLPKEALGQIKGLSSFSSFFAKKIYRCIARVCKFKKRREYWQRYHPQTSPSYLLFSESSIGINEIRALIKVFRASL